MEALVRLFVLKVKNVKIYIVNCTIFEEDPPWLKRLLEILGHCKDRVVGIKYSDKICLSAVCLDFDDTDSIDERSAVNHTLDAWDCLDPVKHIPIIQIST